jgi:F-type H+-transporting ATPase subunit delta
MAKTMKQSRRRAKQLFRWCLIEGSLDEARSRQVVRAVLQARRRGYLAVLEQFHRLVKLELAKHTARLESAAPLSSALQGRVRERLQSSHGAGITTFFQQNPALIGGIRIQVGSDVYNGSVQAGLAALRRSFGIAE